MNRYCLMIAVVSICFIACPSVADADDKGFAPLFGQAGLAGWKVSDWSDVAAPQRAAGTPWKIENDLLIGLNKHTWLISPREYGDFVLKLETRISEGANGGIGLRFPPKGDPAYTGMEIQVVDCEVYYSGRGAPQQCTGSIYDEIPADQSVVKPVGHWNAWEITAQASHIQIVINGRKVIDVDLSTQTTARQQKGPALSERPLKGHIGFQNLRGAIELRNVMVKEISSDADDSAVYSKKAEIHTHNRFHTNKICHFFINNESS